MHLAVIYEVLPSDWSNLFSTFIDAGISRYWCDSADVEIPHNRRSKDGARLRRIEWVHAPYGVEGTYLKEWRAIICVQPELVGDWCFDGVTWGFNKRRDRIKRRYTLTAESFARIADKAPRQFADWLEGGDRNISTHFDAGTTDSIFQLACFGVEVFG